MQCLCFNGEGECLYELDAPARFRFSGNATRWCLSVAGYHMYGHLRIRYADKCDFSL